MNICNKRAQWCVSGIEERREKRRNELSGTGAGVLLCDSVNE